MDHINGGQEVIRSLLFELARPEIIELKFLIIISRWIVERPCLMTQNSWIINLEQFYFLSHISFRVINCLLKLFQIFSEIKFGITVSTQFCFISQFCFNVLERGKWNKNEWGHYIESCFKSEFWIEYLNLGLLRFLKFLTQFLRPQG